MKTLTALYQEREGGLRERLKAAHDLDAAVGVLQAELTWLESVYSAELTVPQQRAFLAGLEILRASLRGMKDGLGVERVPQRRGLLAVLLGILGAGASKWRARLDTDTFLRYFRGALETLDGWLALQPTPQPAEDRRELLEFLQRLMGYAQTGKVALLQERMDQLPQIMERYGIRYVSYDPRVTPRSGAAARRLFKFEASLDPALAQVQTLVPAVVQGDEVLFRGLVVEPVSTRQASRCE